MSQEFFKRGASALARSPARVKPKAKLPTLEEIKLFFEELVEGVHVGRARSNSNPEEAKKLADNAISNGRARAKSDPVKLDNAVSEVSHSSSPLSSNSASRDEIFTNVRRKLDLSSPKSSLESEMGMTSSFINSAKSKSILGGSQSVGYQLNKSLPTANAQKAKLSTYVAIEEPMAQTAAETMSWVAKAGALVAGATLFVTNDNNDVGKSLVDAVSEHNPHSPDSDHTSFIHTDDRREEDNNSSFLQSTSDWARARLDEAMLPREIQSVMHTLGDSSKHSSSECDDF